MGAEPTSTTNFQFVLCFIIFKKVKSKSGKYLFIGNINSLFAPPLKYANTIKELKLKKFDKKDIKNNESLLFTIRDGNIVRINCSGKIMS
jgi:hypothetical protein